VTNGTNILALRASLLKCWGFNDIPPFRGVPSDDINELIRVFVNRNKEMQRAILTLHEGENVLVRGMTGIGKTAFIMATLYQMEAQAKEIDSNILPIHIRQFTGGTREDLYKIILYALAKRLSSENDRAGQILRLLTGEEMSKGGSGSIKGGIEVQIPQFLKASIGSDVGESETSKFSVGNYEHFVGELLEEACKDYQRIIIAIDDLERSPNQGTIKSMLESSLDLIRDNRCGFVLTGRTLTILEDVYATGLDIFNETIPLKPLSAEELRSITSRTLNLVRNKPQDDDVSPFTDEVINIVASKSSGIPRQFILICGRVLKIAVENGAESLNGEVFKRSFEQLQEEIAQQEVLPDIRRILYLGLQKGGFSISKDADLDEVFDIIGVSTLKQFVDFADTLVQQDLLQRFADERGEILYRIAPGVEKLALSGAEQKDETANQD
jgi:Cdc6-like AAA superfamily ATPase